jgi:hypothetical protein
MEGRLSFPAAMAVQCHLRRCHDCRLVHDAARRTLRAYFDEDFASSAKVA